MTISKFLKNSEKQLAKQNIPTSRLDCLILLEDVLNKDKSWLLAHPEHELTDEQTDILKQQIERRAKHKPLAYIRGKSEFYDREFIVTADTLQPRPETETMLELLLDLAEGKKLNAENIVDVGTGSGAIAITLKLEVPECEVLATDISEKCIQVATKNAKLHQADITFVQTNLVDAVGANDLNNSVLCCNLPYVPDSFTINQAAMFEPKIAIFGGKDGLDYYRQLFEQLNEKQARPKAVFTESLPTQHKKLAEIAKNYGYKQKNSQDFIQVFVVSG